jgi:hypothetical protein
MVLMVTALAPVPRAPARVLVPRRRTAPGPLVPVVVVVVARPGPGRVSVLPPGRRPGARARVPVAVLAVTVVATAAGRRRLWRRSVGVVLAMMDLRLAGRGTVVDGDGLLLGREFAERTEGEQRRAALHGHFSSLLFFQQTFLVPRFLEISLVFNAFLFLVCFCSLSLWKAKTRHVHPRRSRHC